MLRDMPCGKERVIHYQNPVGETPLFTERLNAGTWFGFAEVDMDICPVIALVCGTWLSNQSWASHNLLSGDADLHLVCGAGHRGPAHWGCGQEQSPACWGVQTAGKQRLTNSSAGAPNVRGLHKGWEGGGQSTAKSLLQRSGRVRASLWARKQEAT